VYVNEDMVGKTNIKLEAELRSALQSFKKCDIFTPVHICKDMANLLVEDDEQHNKNDQCGLKLLEPSVGIGSLLTYIDLTRYTQIDVFDIKSHYLDQISQPTRNLRKHHCDFLKTDFPPHQKYDHIILNPPYIKIQELPVEYRKFLQNNYSCLWKSGNFDIYLAFIAKCIQLLDQNGVMISIHPNTFLTNKSALRLRKYLFENRFIEKIINFEHQPIFDGVAVYCCIVKFSKRERSHLLYNDRSIPYSDLLQSPNFSLFNYSNFMKKSIRNTRELSLRDICTISNGIATLRDKIFIHNCPLYNEPCWKPITNGPSDKYIIYPYTSDCIIMEEPLFAQQNPQTYQYLLSYKNELAKRDNGKKNYPTWFAYGRTQSIRFPHNNWNCIYIPSFIDPAFIDKKIFIKNNTLHTSCLRIQPKNQHDINRIIATVINNIDFINENSSKRSGGWINLSSSVLYQLQV
jgi:hypothetical protein